ncbi:MAG: hypothetical protein AAGK23_11665 [Pseudomonadota bacterium]
MGSLSIGRGAALMLAFSVLAASASAQDFGHGNGALELFDTEGQANSPTWVMVWVAFMLATFAAGLFFVRKRIEARWAVGGFILGILCMALLVQGIGLPPLSGFIALIHLVFWTPALILLVQRRTFLKERSLYGAWTAIMTGVILFSFVFDIRDAAIYLDYVLGIGALS